MRPLADHVTDHQHFGDRPSLVDIHPGDREK